MSPATRTAPKRCTCGKVGWPSKRLADDVVVRAKIAYCLRGNARRREQRAYRCTSDSTLFHVTSQPERDHTKPWWTAEDDDTARDFLIRAVFAEDTRMRSQLLEAAYLYQTARVLNDINAGVNSRLQGSRDWAEAAPTELQRNSRSVDARHERKLLQGLVTALAPWRKAARDAIRVRNVAGSASQAYDDKVQVTRTLRTLTLAVVEHERGTSEPSAADQQLYDLLAQLHLPGVVSQPSLRHLVDSEAWH